VADIGSVLGGRYRLLELLGQGGMATIYRARDGQLERDVAVKVLRPEYGRDPDFFARFRQEAQSAASLNHPGVVAVYDYGTDAVGPFIVMELVDGEDLASIIRRTGALPPRQAARLTTQIARAIGAAHERGFVHRDVKPGNVLVTREGRAKVADFGIARALAEAALTLPGTTLGSVHYFSPEQARGEPTTPAADIYSLGIVLYELLTGRRPWEGDTAAAVATARLSGPVPSPSNVRAGIPPVLEAVTRKAMAFEPDQRFASAAEMADALDRYLAESVATVGGAPARGAGEPAAGGRASLGAAAIGGASVGAAVAGAEAGAGGSAAGPGAGAGSGRAAAGATAGPVAGTKGGAAAAGPDGPLVGQASPNPGARLPYPPEAYARAEPPRRGRPAGGDRRAPDAYPDEDDARSGTGPWLWVSALLALAILALAAYLVFRLVSGATVPPTSQVSVPNFVGMTFEQAQAAAGDARLQVARSAFEPSDQAEGTVLSQDPPEGTPVDPESTVKLTLAVGSQTVEVPDLRGKTESVALNLIAAANLTVGTRAEEFDAFIPAGSVVSQDPGVGQLVSPRLPVNYVVSKGPEPSPSPSSTPEPSPTLPPEPTVEPTPTPTPAPLNVGDYRCLTFADATASILADGFSVGSTDGDTSGRVVAQAPSPGAKAAFGAPINLTFENPPVSLSCP